MTLDSTQLADALTKLDGWGGTIKGITKSFSTDDFNHSLELVERIGELAEEQDHHPELIVRYDEVVVNLSTHSAGGVTEQDITLAQGIEESLL